MTVNQPNATEVLAPEISLIPEVVAIIRDCYERQVMYPARVVIIHQADCNILVDHTIPAHEHSCTPVSVKSYPQKNKNRWR